jgi:hypothetical protein
LLVHMLWYAFVTCFDAVSTHSLCSFICGQHGACARVSAQVKCYVCAQACTGVGPRRVRIGFCGWSGEDLNRLGVRIGLG